MGHCKTLQLQPKSLDAALQSFVATSTCLLATVWHRDGSASLDPVEEPLLHRVVVQGTVDVDGAHAGEGDPLVCQELLCIKLALQETDET